jgi:thioredoxin reductase
MATAAAPKAGITHARPKAKDDKKDGKTKGPVFATDFGSHANMVNAELTEKIAAAKQDQADPWQILTDERGNYATRKSRIDSGLGDPNRYADLPAREKQVKELTPA